MTPGDPEVQTLFTFSSYRFMIYMTVPIKDLYVVIFKRFGA